MQSRCRPWSCQGNQARRLTPFDTRVQTHECTHWTWECTSLKYIKTHLINILSSSSILEYTLLLLRFYSPCQLPTNGSGHHFKILRNRLRLSSLLGIWNYFHTVSSIHHIVILRQKNTLPPSSHGYATRNEEGSWNFFFLPLRWWLRWDTNVSILSSSTASASSCDQNREGGKVLVKTSAYSAFLSNPPKCFFKALFIGTELGQLLQSMSEAKSALKGLENNKCDQGRLKNCLPIPYVPIEMDESEKNAKPSVQKIMLPGNSQFSVQVWTGNGTDEQFLLHTIEARDACVRKGFFNDYSNHDDCENKFVEKLAKLHSKDPEDLEATSASELRLEIKKCKRICANSVKKKLEAAKSIFSTYTSLLGPKVRPHWEAILSQQVNCDPWKDLQGVSCTPACEKSITTFNDCVTYHLLTVFTNYAAERQKLYISNQLRKPNKVTIKVFSQRVQQLNSYLQHLPCLFDSTLATTKTSKSYHMMMPTWLVSFCRCVRQAGLISTALWNDTCHKTQGVFYLSSKRLRSVIQARPWLLNCPETRKQGITRHPASARVGDMVPLTPREFLARMREPRNIAAYVRSMGVHTLLIIRASVVSTRRMAS